MKKQIDRVLELVLVVLTTVMVINVLWQVFSRYVLADPSSFTDELARFLLIWVGLLGAAYASGRRMHLAIELLPQALEGKKKQYLDWGITGAVIAFVVAVMVIGGINLIYITLTLGQMSPQLQIPYGYIYLVLPLSGILIIYYRLYFLFNEQTA